MFCYSLQNLGVSPDIPICVRDTYQAHTSILHEHDYLEIAIIRRGHGEHIIRNNDNRELQTSVMKGDVFTVLNGEKHSYKMCRDFRMYNICIGWDYFNKFREMLKPLEYFAAFLAPGREFGVNMRHLPPVVFQEVERVVQKLRQALNGNYPSKHLTVQIAFLELLCTLFDGGYRGIKHTPHTLDERLFKTIAAMEEHPEFHFSVAKAAKESNMSISSYAHKFKDAIGVSPTEYCIMLRLEKSRQMLENSVLSIEEIAIGNGFCDGNYFGRLFRKRYGITPRDHRKIFRDNYKESV